MNRVNILAIILLTVGLSQMASDLFHLPILKGLGAATMCSPCPKVFTAHNGYETFSTKLVIEWTSPNKNPHSLNISRDIYTRIDGPYSRRKIFESLIVHWPIASKDSRISPMFQSIAKYAFTGKAPLLHELGIPDNAQNIQIRYTPIIESPQSNYPTLIKVSSL